MLVKSTWRRFLLLLVSVLLFLFLAVSIPCFMTSEEMERAPSIIRGFRRLLEALFG